MVDLANGYFAAMRYPEARERGVVFTTNLGIGNVYTVLEMPVMFEKFSGKKVSDTIVDCCPDDIAGCFFDTSYAILSVGWKAEFGSERVPRDTWCWEKRFCDRF